MNGQQRLVIGELPEQTLAPEAGLLEQPVGLKLNFVKLIGFSAIA